MRVNYLSAKDIVLKKRRLDSHKGDNGKVLIVGGSMEYAGAVMLAGMAAFRSGADIVVIAAPEKIALAINAWPDFITAKFKGSYFRSNQASELIRMSKGYDVLLIGNGIGLRSTTKQFARKSVKGCICKKVIDADAIKSVRLQDVRNAIITPHKKEFRILLENSGLGNNSSMLLVQKLVGSNVILLKGKTDTIISKNKIVYNKTGNAGMTVGGTGDVLAGLCAGLVAQGNNLFESACAAAYLNGYAGDLLYRELGYGFTATDLADKLAFVLKKWC